MSDTQDHATASSNPERFPVVELLDATHHADASLDALNANIEGAGTTAPSVSESHAATANPQLDGFVALVAKGPFNEDTAEPSHADRPVIGADSDEKAKQDGIEIEASTTKPGMIHANSVAEEDAAMQGGANGDEKTKQDGIEINASTTNPGMIRTTSVAEEDAAMQEATSLEREKSVGADDAIDEEITREEDDGGFTKADTTETERIASEAPKATSEKLLVAEAKPVNDIDLEDPANVDAHVSVPEDELALQKHDVLPQDAKNEDIYDVTLDGTDGAIEGSADSADIVDAEAPTGKTQSHTPSVQAVNATTSDEPHTNTSEDTSNLVAVDEAKEENTLNSLPKPSSHIVDSQSPNVAPSSPEVGAQKPDEPKDLVDALSSLEGEHTADVTPTECAADLHQEDATDILSEANGVEQGFDKDHPQVHNPQPVPSSPKLEEDVFNVAITQDQAVINTSVDLTAVGANEAGAPATEAETLKSPYDAKNNNVEPDTVFSTSETTQESDVKLESGRTEHTSSVESEPEQPKPDQTISQTVSETLTAPTVELKSEDVPDTEDIRDVNVAQEKPVPPEIQESDVILDTNASLEDPVVLHEASTYLASESEQPDTPNPTEVATRSEAPIEQFVDDKKASVPDDGEDSSLTRAEPSPEVTPDTNLEKQPPLGTIADLPLTEADGQNIEAVHVPYTGTFADHHEAEKDFLKDDVEEQPLASTGETQGLHVQRQTGPDALILKPQEDPTVLQQVPPSEDHGSIPGDSQNEKVPPQIVEKHQLDAPDGTSGTLELEDQSAVDTTAIGHPSIGLHEESSTYIPPETNDAVHGSFDQSALHEDDTAPAIDSPTHGPKALDTTSEEQEEPSTLQNATGAAANRAALDLSTPVTTEAASISDHDAEINHMKPDVVTTGLGEVHSKSEPDHVDQIPRVEDEAQGRIVDPSVSDKTFAASTPSPELTIEPKSEDAPGGEHATGVDMAQTPPTSPEGEKSDVSTKLLETREESEIPTNVSGPSVVLGLQSEKLDHSELTEVATTSEVPIELINADKKESPSQSSSITQLQLTDVNTSGEDPSPPVNLSQPALPQVVDRSIDNGVVRGFYTKNIEAQHDAIFLEAEKASQLDSVEQTMQPINETEDLHENNNALGQPGSDTILTYPKDDPTMDRQTPPSENEGLISKELQGEKIEQEPGTPIISSTAEVVPEASDLKSHHLAEATKFKSKADLAAPSSENCSLTHSNVTNTHEADASVPKQAKSSPEITEIPPKDDTQPEMNVVKVDKEAHHTPERRVHSPIAEDLVNQDENDAASMIENATSEKAEGTPVVTEMAESQEGHESEFKSPVRPLEDNVVPLIDHTTVGFAGKMAPANDEMTTHRDLGATSKTVEDAAVSELVKGQHSDAFDMDEDTQDTPDSQTPKSTMGEIQKELQVDVGPIIPGDLHSDPEVVTSKVEEEHSLLERVHDRAFSGDSIEALPQSSPDAAVPYPDRAISADQHTLQDNTNTPKSDLIPVATSLEPDIVIVREHDAPSSAPPDAVPISGMDTTLEDIPETQALDDSSGREDSRRREVESHGDEEISSEAHVDDLASTVFHTQGIVDRQGQTATYEAVEVSLPEDLVPEMHHDGSQLENVAPPTTRDGSLQEPEAETYDILRGDDPDTENLEDVPEAVYSNSVDSLAKGMDHVYRPSFPQKAVDAELSSTLPKDDSAVDGDLSPEMTALAVSSDVPSVLDNPDGQLEMPVDDRDVPEPPATQMAMDIKPEVAATVQRDSDKVSSIESENVEASAVVISEIQDETVSSQSRPVDPLHDALHADKSLEDEIQSFPESTSELPELLTQFIGSRLPGSHYVPNGESDTESDASLHDQGIVKGPLITRILIDKRSTESEAAKVGKSEAESRQETTPVAEGTIPLVDASYDANRSDVPEVATTPRSELGILTPTFDSRSEVSAASNEPNPPLSPRTDLSSPVMEEFDVPILSLNGSLAPSTDPEILAQSTSEEAASEASVKPLPPSSPVQDITPVSTPTREDSVSDSPSLLHRNHGSELSVADHVQSDGKENPEEVPATLTTTREAGRPSLIVDQLGETQSRAEYTALEVPEQELQTQSFAIHEESTPRKLESGLPEMHFRNDTATAEKNSKTPTHESVPQAGEQFPSTEFIQKERVRVEPILIPLPEDGSATKSDTPSTKPRTRLPSTASSRLLPGGWVSDSPRPQGRASLDIATGEFSPPIRPNSIGEEVEPGAVKKKSRLSCVVM